MIPELAALVVLAGLAALAFVDVERRTVDPWATALLGWATVFAAAHDGLTAGEWLTGVVCAGLTFLAYLELGVAGQIGGGDVKLAPIPAFVLGSANPLLALWWFAAAGATQTMLQLLTSGRRGGFVPHLPAMLAAMMFACMLAGALL